MEIFMNKKCITFKELVDNDNPIISKPTYDKLSRTNKIQVILHGGGGHPALISYDSLPDHIRTAYDKLYPNADKEIQNKMMRDTLITDAKAVVYYRDKAVDRNGNNLPDTVQRECVLNAEVMNAMRKAEVDAKALHAKSGYNRPSLCKEIVIGTCEKLREIFGHTLPGSEQRLIQKYNQYKKFGYKVLIKGYCGNKNSSKITAVEGRLLLRLKRSKLPIYTDSQIFEEFNKTAEQHGYNVIKSVNTLHNYLYSPEVEPLWHAAVYGMQSFKSKYSSQMSTELPQMRDTLWYSDGTKLNLYYKDERGKMCTTSVYEVCDAYSEVLLGYDIAPGETFDSQYRAFRMAVETAGVRPFEIVNDNQGGHRKLSAQGFFDKIALLHRPTMPYNGQSKTIESIFGRFQAQILHKIWYFTGQNVTTTKKNSHPNIEFIEANAYALPSFDELKEIYRKCRAEWNTSEHPKTGISRLEMYKLSTNTETKAIDQADMIQMFWLTSQKAVEYTNKGLRIEINKQVFDYDVYAINGLRDERWALHNTKRRFRVMYDPMDMTKVELYEETSTGFRYSATATPKVTIHRATQERTTSETEFMRRTISQNKETMAAVHLETEDFDIKEAIAAELFGLNTPKPKNISKKDMTKFREKYDNGLLTSPVSIPVTSENETGYDSIGEFTKEISNLTFDEISCLNKI